MLAQVIRGRVGDPERAKAMLAEASTSRDLHHSWFASAPQGVRPRRWWSMIEGSLTQP